jgi:CHASE2 domain-containing sensor protein
MSNNPIELYIAQERLRQARYSFNLALVATALSACISLLGAGLLLSGKVPEGAVTAAGGMAASVRCIQLAKDSNDRLDKILPELKDED